MSPVPTLPVFSIFQPPFLNFQALRALSQLQYISGYHYQGYEIEGHIIHKKSI